MRKIAYCLIGWMNKENQNVFLQETKARVYQLQGNISLGNILVLMCILRDMLISRLLSILIYEHRGR